MRSLTLALALAAAALAALPRGAEATAYGVDISQPVLESAWQCLVGEHSVSWAIPRCYQSTGQPDPNCPHTIYNAWAGGVQYVDVYLFPCPSCGNAAGQVQAMVDNLANYNIHHGQGANNYGLIWLDIEGSQYWLGSEGANQQFFAELLQAAQAAGPVGVYTNEDEWGSIMGNSYTGGSGVPLWYPTYDGTGCSFSDFSPFAGWSSPFAKQYIGSTTLCGVGVDVDCAPNLGMAHTLASNETAWREWMGEQATMREALKAAQPTLRGA